MAWPKIEVHFSNIDARPDRTNVMARVYTATDGGLDAQGNQILIRTLRRTLDLKLDAGTDRDRLLENIRNRRLSLNSEFGTNIQAADFIATL